MKSFWTRCERFPPVLCRLLARGGPYGAPLSNEDLVQLTGLSEFEVTAISQQTDWRGIDIYTMRKFTEACGVDFTDRVAMKRIHTYINGAKVAGRRVPPKFAYLRKSQDWSSLYEPLIRKLCDQQTTRGRTSTQVSSSTRPRPS